MPGLKAAVRGALDSAFPGPDAVALLPGFVGAGGRAASAAPPPVHFARVSGLILAAVAVLLAGHHEIIGRRHHPA
jgi:hypothetical protein